MYYCIEHIKNIYLFAINNSDTCLTSPFLSAFLDSILSLRFIIVSFLKVKKCPVWLSSLTLQ